MKLPETRFHIPMFLFAICSKLRQHAHTGVQGVSRSMARARRLPAHLASTLADCGRLFVPNRQNSAGLSADMTIQPQRRMASPANLLSLHPPSRYLIFRSTAWPIAAICTHKFLGFFFTSSKASDSNDPIFQNGYACASVRRRPIP